MRINWANMWAKVREGVRSLADKIKGNVSDDEKAELRAQAKQIGLHLIASSADGDFDSDERAELRELMVDFAELLGSSALDED